MQAPADDPELARWRVTLAALRPDADDPLQPIPDRPAAPSTVLPAGAAPDAWDRLPRGLFLGPLAERMARERTAAEVLAEVDALALEHAEALRWARTNGTLAKGVRGFYADAGIAAALRGRAPAGALARWNGDLAARREGAYALGRRVMLAAAAAWEAAKNSPAVTRTSGSASPDPG